MAAGDPVIPLAESLPERSRTAEGQRPKAKGRRTKDEGRKKKKSGRQ
jgi:hypothetical protein